MSEGLLQRHGRLDAEVKAMRAETKEQFDGSKFEALGLLARICAIEEALGITGATGGESVPPGRFDGAPGIYGSVEEENNVRLRRLEDAVTSIREVLAEKSDFAQLREEMRQKIGRQFFEIPKRQNPPPRVRKAAKMATTKPTTTRKR